ncbi:MAG: hypothetical protein JKX76_01285 [Colwellia sp.]|nr:hypothetical protein [Colwellia sp.]
MSNLEEINFNDEFERLNTQLTAVWNNKSIQLNQGDYVTLSNNTDLQQQDLSDGVINNSTETVQNSPKISKTDYIIVAGIFIFWFAVLFKLSPKFVTSSVQVDDTSSSKSSNDDVKDENTKRKKSFLKMLIYSLVLTAISSILWFMIIRDRLPG